MSDSCDVTYSEMKHKTKATHYQKCIPPNAAGIQRSL